MNKFFLVLSFLIVCTTIVAQKKEFISIAINGERKNAQSIRNNFAFSYEKQISKHNGLEIGLNERGSERYTVGSYSNGTFQTFNVLENYFTMPFLYKFSSNILNLSTGVSFDYFVGWKDITKFGDTELTSYSINPKIQVGWVFKISKSIPLTTKFLLEPEIYFNPIFNYGYSYSGLSMKLKYQL
jgi:hypothetical protein